MKIMFFLFLIFFLSFFQSTFLPFNLILLFVISLAVFLPAGQSLTAAFGLGLLVDLISGGPLGLSSLIFLNIVLLINLYRSRFPPEELRFLLPFTFLSIFLFNLINGQAREWGRIILNTGLIIPFLLISQKLEVKTQNYKLKVFNFKLNF